MKFEITTHVANTQVLGTLFSENKEEVLTIRSYEGLDFYSVTKNTKHSDNYSSSHETTMSKNDIKGMLEFFNISEQHITQMLQLVEKYLN